MRAVPDLIARWVPGDYTSLGTDGFGMSDTRHALRRHFHVDAETIVVATLRQLALRGEVPLNGGRGRRPQVRHRRRHRRPGRRDRRRHLSALIGVRRGPFVDGFGIRRGPS